MSTAKFSTWLNPNGTENYKCRAWVNFNGTGTVAIRAAGNVASITDNSTGTYTVNFTTAMPDTNYALVSGSLYINTVGRATIGYPNTPAKSTTSVLITVVALTTAYDITDVEVAIFR
jgi:hypothetical protein